MEKMYMYANGPELRRCRFSKTFLWKKIVLEGLEVYVGLEPLFIPSWDGIRIGTVSSIISWLVSWFYFRLNRRRSYLRHQIEIKNISEWQTQIRFLVEDKKQTLRPLDLQYSVVYLRGEGKKHLIRSWSNAKREELTWRKELNAFQAWLIQEASVWLKTEGKKWSMSPPSLNFAQDEIINQKASTLLGIPAGMLKLPRTY
ncbi:MAG: hypothetical protein WC768_03770 [Patescibacteria group bacterium]|jgi:hypothetical protein